MTPNTQLKDVLVHQNDIAQDAMLMIFRELLRYATHYGISVGDIHDIVDVSAANLEKSDPKLKLSKEHTLTKEQRARLESSDLDKKRSFLDMPINLSVILDGWHTDDAFVTAYAGPKQLMLRSSDKDDGGQSTFEDLVMKYGSGVSVDEALACLQEGGHVSIIGGNVVAAQSREYMASSQAGMLVETSKLIWRAIRTATHNSIADRKADRKLERWIVTTRGLSPAIYEEFCNLVKEKGTEFLLTLDNFIERYDEDTEGVQTGVSVFQFVDS